jgi:hypothetical protein
MKLETLARRFLMLGLLALTVAPQARAQPAVSDEVFYDQLAPSGDWLYVSPYGRVWQPRGVGPDFRPYATSGHWVYTDYGWSFASDYPWGWATFHYGRWALDPSYGWIWVPGYDWAPAWVDWRYGGGYIGWAPLAPFGARIVIESYYPAWCFVPTRYFLERDFYHYAAPFDHVHRVWGITAPNRNEVAYSGRRWYAGPPPGHIAQAVGRPVPAMIVNPPAQGVVQPVHIGAPAGVATGPSPRPVPGSPSGTPSPGAHFNPGAGWGPSRGQPGGGTAVSPVPSPQTHGQPGTPIGVPAAPGGVRMQQGWGANPQGPPSAPMAPPPARSATPAPHGEFMNPVPPRSVPVSPPAPTYHSIPYPQQARVSPPAQTVPLRPQAPAMQQPMHYQPPAMVHQAPAMSPPAVSHPAPIGNQGGMAPVPNRGGSIAAHGWTARLP